MLQVHKDDCWKQHPISKQNKPHHLLKLNKLLPTPFVWPLYLHCCCGFFLFFFRWLCSSTVNLHWLYNVLHLYDLTKCLMYTLTKHTHTHLYFALFHQREYVISVIRKKKKLFSGFSTIQSHLISFRCSQNKRSRWHYITKRPTFNCFILNDDLFSKRNSLCDASIWRLFSLYNPESSPIVFVNAF